MAYKLIIVDDEDIIRNGLMNVVDWPSLGFEVTADMEDGRDAIEYIQKYPVDVVLTDIKMTFTSGLEIARYVYENKPEVKVVIISGYKEFEFAKQAISYNVTHYLLKPTEYNELVKVFNDVKTQLDKEQTAKQRLDNVRKQHEELIPYARQQFLTDIINGAIQDKEKIRDRLDLTGLNVDMEKDRCCLMNIKIQDMNRYLKTNSNYSKDSIYMAVHNFINCVDSRIKYIPVYNEHERIHVIAIALEAMPEENFKKLTVVFANKLKGTVKTFLNMDIDIEVAKTSENLCSMAADSAYINYLDSSSEYERLVEQQKLLLSYIRAGSLDETCNIFNNIVNRLKILDFDTLINFLAGLFIMIENLLKDIGYDLFSASKGNFNYKKIFDSRDASEIISWAKDNLVLIINHIREHEGVSEEQIIAKAKDYIRENYSRDISLEDVSEHVYLSSGYFSKLFKQHTGENYIDYLIRVRMDKAKELLEQTRYKTYDIGESVGYTNTKYFLRLFKKYTGMTPSEYRNLYSGRGAAE